MPYAALRGDHTLLAYATFITPPVKIAAASVLITFTAIRLY